MLIYGQVCLHCDNLCLSELTQRLPEKVISFFHMDSCSAVNWGPEEVFSNSEQTWGGVTQLVSLACTHGGYKHSSLSQDTATIF